MTHAPDRRLRAGVVARACTSKAQASIYTMEKHGVLYADTAGGVSAAAGDHLEYPVQFVLGPKLNLDSAARSSSVDADFRTQSEAHPVLGGAGMHVGCRGRRSSRGCHARLGRRQLLHERLG